MKKNKVSLILNILVVFFVVLGCIFMFTGFRFMEAETLLEATKIEMFKFFTVDSNILMGICSLIFVIYDIKLLKGESKNIPSWVYKFKLIGTAAVGLTFVTTLFFLAPQYGFYQMYNNTNLFFHLIVPVLAIVSFIIFESYEFKYKDALLGVIPMLLYSVYYTTNVLLHLENGKPTWEYDFYGFLRGNVYNVFISIPVIILVTYTFSLIIVFLNNKLLKK